MPPSVVVGASFLIAPSFVVLMASLHSCAPDSKKVWSQIGLSFAIIYAVVVGLNYFLFLTVVQQNPQLYSWLSMDLRPDSAFWALEVLGYTFMSLGALFLAPLLTRGKIEHTIRWLFVGNAALNIIAVAAYLQTVNPVHPLVLGSLGLWGVVFPIATALLAVVFRRGEPIG